MTNHVETIKDVSLSAVAGGTLVGSYIGYINGVLTTGILLLTLLMTLRRYRRGKDE